MNIESFTLKPLFKPLSTFLVMLTFLSSTVLQAQTINFDQYTLDASGVPNSDIYNPTALQFGPDGRLYVTGQKGMMQAYTVERVDNGGNISYVATASELISIVQQGVPNHNDDGTNNASQERQVTGIVVTGTALNPVLYVSSSDVRIAVGNDSNLDTNSGVISKLTCPGGVTGGTCIGGWNKVDIVRGLPRCEENHASNGMDIDETTNTLYVMQGGNTNKGAPNNEFGGSPEYFFSAALISVDLNQIDGMTVYTDPRNNAQYVYDLPTLNDPTRTDINNSHSEFPYPAGHPMYNATIDLGDPFGGNNSLNQAIPEPGGPVQVYAPGFRNAYDIVFTTQGRLYSSDNGPNSNWGGQPLVYAADGTPKGTGPIDIGAGDYITNEFNESDAEGHGDPLHFISGAGYYGGHPTPIRAFPDKAGIINYVKQGGNWVQSGPTYDFGNLLNGISGYYNNSLDISDFPGNPTEGVYSSNDPSKYVDIINASTNGIAEYTASNFAGQLQGHILTVSFTGFVYDYGMNAAGDAYVSKSDLFSGFGSLPLGIDTQGDNDVFPGVIAVAVYGENKVAIFEPNDYGQCLQPGDPGYDPNADYDNDQYTNQDEIDNGTNHCSGGSQPQDNDKTLINGFLVSDLNDPDDDDDGIIDILDNFQHDANNGLATNLPVNYPFWNNDPGFGFFGVGFNALMGNGSTDYLQMYDISNLTVGGATGKFTIDNTTSGGVTGNTNDQQYAFQMGINVDENSNQFTAHTEIEAPFFGVNGNQTTPLVGQSYGFYIGKGDMDNYLKVVVTNLGGMTGIQVDLEENGNLTSSAGYGPGIVGDLFSSSGIDLYISVNPAAGTASPFVSTDGGNTVIAVGPAINIPSSWLSSADNMGLAVGLIASHGNSGVPFTATWDFLLITEEMPGVLSPLTTPIDFGELQIGSSASTIILEALNEGGPSSGSIQVTNVTVTGTDQADFGFTGTTPINIVPGGLGQIPVTYTPGAIGTKSANLNIFHDGNNSPVVVPLLGETIDEPEPLFRVNTGGPAITAIDGSAIDWEEDSQANNSQYLVEPGPNKTSSFTMTGYDPSVDQSVVPVGIFNTERTDFSWDPILTYSFPVAPGDYVINLYIANGYGGTDQPNDRVYDISVEGVVPSNFSNLDPVALFGHQMGGKVTATVTVSDGALDMQFLHTTENPLINGIEILGNPNNVVLPLSVQDIQDQTNDEGDGISLSIVASGGDAMENFTYGATGLPPGIMVEPTNGQIFGTIDYDAATNSPYSVTVTVDKPSSSPANTTFQWFVNAVNKTVSITSPADGATVSGFDLEVCWTSTGINFTNGELIRVTVDNPSYPDPVDIAYTPTGCHTFMNVGVGTWTATVSMIGNGNTVLAGPDQVTVTLTGDAPGDADNDGFNDDVDTCPTVANPSQEIPTYYKDADQDGYSDGTTQTQCVADAGYYLASTLMALSGDCNDNDDTIYPGATEIPNDGIDQDCDGSDLIVLTGADLELSISANPTTLPIWEYVLFTLTLENFGPETATDIVISAPLPSGFAFDSATSSDGLFNNFTYEWTIPSLASGEVATLDINLFVLQDAASVDFYTQVVGVTNDDPDSTPNNNAGPVPVEDDEAVVTVLAPGAGPQDQTITFGPLADMFTTDAPFNVSATASSGLPVSFDVISGPATINGTMVTLNGLTGTVVIEATQAGNADYNAATPVQQSFNVTKQDQTITFDPIPNKLTTDVPFDVNATASSGLTVSFEIISGPATIDGTTITLDGTTGTVVVEATQTGDADYNAAVAVQQSFDITEPGQPQDQTITFGPLADKFTTDAPFDVSATATSGLLVSFEIISGPATIDGSTITLDGTTGTVVVEATQAGNADYNAATPVQQSFDVTKQDQTIIFAPISDQFTTSAPFDVSATATSGLAVSLEIISGPATIDGSTITLDGVIGTVVVEATQAGDGDYNAATPVQQSFEVTEEGLDVIDLELTIGANDLSLTPWTNVTFTATLQNTGDITATGVSVSVPIPTGFAYVSQDEQQGIYNAFFQVWEIAAMAPGEVATMSLTLFILEPANPYTYFGEVMTANETDRDSSPGNNGGSIPVEDDEASIVLGDVAGPQDQIITFPQIADKLTTDAPFQIAATATSGLAVSFEIISGPASINGDIITLDGTAGTVTVEATQAGNADFNPATPVQQSFSVSEPGQPQDQTITFPPIADKLTTDAPFQVVATASSGLAVSFEIISGPASVNGDIITLDGTVGTVVVEATQAGDANYNAATPVQQSFNITEPSATDIDLELSVTADDLSLTSWTNVTFTVTLENKGGITANNIKVSVPVPAGFAYVSQSEQQGLYNNYFLEWDIASLDAGATATMDLTLFILEPGSPFNYFVQVLAVDENDADSTPNNNATDVPVEDDEAVVILGQAGSASQADLDRTNENTFRPGLINQDVENDDKAPSLQGSSFTKRQTVMIYPNPATDQLFVNLNDFVGQDASIQILDVLGRVHNITQLDDIQIPVHRLDIQSLDDGMYMLNVVIDGKQPYSQKFLVQR